MAKVSNLNAKIKKRWDAVKRKSFVDEIAATGKPKSPFGCEENLNDFAGITVDDALVITNKVVESLNFEASKIFRLLLKDARLCDINFRNSTISLLVNNSIIYKCDFSSAKLNGSGMTGNSKWEACTFAEVSIIGGVFKAGNFTSCRFTNSNISNVDFGQTFFERCLFDGIIKGCFFRGTLKDCDLSNSLMQDCAFYGAKFNNCIFPKESVYFSDWGNSLESIVISSRDLRLNGEDQHKIEVLLGLWARDAEKMPENLIIRGDLELMLGEYAGNKLFGLCRKIA